METTTSQAVELFKADGTSAGVWYCATCRTVHGMRVHAARCCDRRCEGCGCQIDKKQSYASRCPPCYVAWKAERKAARRAAAEVVTVWDGPVWDPEGRGYKDGFFSSVEEFEDYYADSEWTRPEWVWLTQPHPFPGLDVDDLIERATEDSFEDAADQVAGKAELAAAVAAFNAANAGLASYTADYSRVLVLAEVTA